MASKPTGKPNGRPTDWSPELGSEIIKLIETGSTLKQVEKVTGINVATILRWVNSKPEFCAAYRAAQGVSAHAEFNDIANDLADKNSVPAWVGSSPKDIIAWKVLKQKVLAWQLAIKDPASFAPKSIQTGADGKSAPTLNVNVIKDPRLEE